MDTAGLQAGPVTVTTTATDARNLTGNGTCTLNVEVPPPPPTCSKINTIQFPDEKRPWRVDNTAKAILDDVASRLKADPNAKIVIVGYADGEKASMAGRQEASCHGPGRAACGERQGLPGAAAGQSIPAVSRCGRVPVSRSWPISSGCRRAPTRTPVPICRTRLPVDESVVKPSENAYPKPPNAAPARHHKKGMEGAAESTGQAMEGAGNAAVEGTEKAAKKTGHAMKKGAKKAEQAVTPSQ